jgi:hypothetical protein
MKCKLVYTAAVAGLVSAGAVGSRLVTGECPIACLFGWPAGNSEARSAHAN